MTVVSTVTDEAVEAAAKALSPDLFSDEENLMHPALRLSGQWQVRHKVRAALEAAVPYLAPKVDREALENCVTDALIVADDLVAPGYSARIEADADDIARVAADAVLALINGGAK